MATTHSQPFTVADAFMQALVEAGVSHCFINTGTDYPGLVESWARAEAADRPLPRLIVCPHEVVAISAAHAMAALTGRAQAVFVHADVGTQNLGGGLHNAARGRVPVLLFAGASPYTQEGELPGSRNYYIQFIQDVPDQRGIVRQYVKWDYELRTGANIHQVVYRALQIAQSDPAGPVYLVGAREVLEQPAPTAAPSPRGWPAVQAGGLAPGDVAALARALATAQRPVVVTSYLGRNPLAVSHLQRLAEQWGIAVVENHPQYVNFPSDHPLHQGFDHEVEAVLAEADLVLVLDSDFPWIPAVERPRRDAEVLVIDVDPLKERIPLWYFPAAGIYRADSAVALQQLLDHMSAWTPPSATAERRQAWAAQHAQRRRAWQEAAAAATDPQGHLNPTWVTREIARRLPADALILNEAVTNAVTVLRYLPGRPAGTLMGSGGSSLGWGGGAAIGTKLAKPTHPVVLFSGDGSYFFGNPAAVYWTARRYRTPFLTVVYNNQGWGSVMGAVRSLHPQGQAVQSGQFWAGLEPSADLGGIARAAGDCWTAVVQHPADLAPALDGALAAVAAGQPAVLDVRLAPVDRT